jgi:zinc transport system substrate-binding protein
VLFLASQVDAEQLPSVCIIDGSDRSLAAAVIANTQQKNQNIVQLDSMQTITQEEIDAGVSYLSVMEENLAVLSEALN